MSQYKQCNLLTQYVHESGVFILLVYSSLLFLSGEVIADSNDVASASKGLQSLDKNVVVFSPSTCDQCTVNYQRYWCPIDFSCHFVNGENTVASSKNNYDNSKRGNNISAYTSSEARLACDKHCASAIPYGGGSVSSGERKCMDMQMCFYGTKECNDCIFAGGVWCEKKQKCFVYGAYPTEKDILNKLPPIPSDYVCVENCEGECTITDENCSICKGFHVNMICGSLLPIILISITVIIGISVIVACPVLYWYQKKRTDQLPNVDESEGKK